MRAEGLEGEAYKRVTMLRFRIVGAIANKSSLGLLSRIGGSSGR